MHEPRSNSRKVGLLGSAGLLLLAAVPFVWSLDEASTGNRVFLWALTAMLVLLAIWRAKAAFKAN
jgi:hypothetical protein